MRIARFSANDKSLFPRREIFAAIITRFHQDLYRLSLVVRRVRFPHVAVFIFIYTLFFHIHYSFAVFFRGQKRSFLRARHAFRVRTRLKEKGAEKMTSSTINLNKDQIRIQRNQQFVDSIIAYI